MTEIKINHISAPTYNGVMKQRMLLFIAMLLVAFQILVSFPIAIWLHNQFDFSAVISDSIGVFGLSFLTVSVLLLLVAVAVPQKIRNHLLPLFVLGSILVYVQQYILVWDYGILDGHLIDFLKNKYLGLLDMGLWMLGVAAYMVLRKEIIRHSITILTFTIIITVVATLTTVMSYDAREGNSTASLSDVNKFTYSENKNILLFLLDGFQSDLFWEIIDQDPQLKEEFLGFTFYANTSAVFAKTFPTIPLLLTGKKYQKEQSFQDFLDTAYQESILTEFVAEGWDVGLHPYVMGTIPLDKSIMSNYLSYTLWPEKIDDYLQALDLSLFRSVPHSLKSYIYNNGDFIIKNNLSNFLHKFDHFFLERNLIEPPNTQPHQGLNFQENLRLMGAISSAKPTFRFYHLFMPHEPFLLNRNLKFGHIGNDFASYQEYAFASLKLMINYINELKNLGVYDNSSIIIAADHGSGEYTDERYISSEGRYIKTLTNGKAMASGKPLLLVKNYHSDSQFKISSKPVSLLDVAPTIANFADMDPKNFEGKIIDEIAEDEQRERDYFHYEFSGWDSKFLNDFDVYQINGNVYDERAWTKTGKLAAKSTVENKQNYALGSTISFGSDLKIDTDYQNAFLVGNDYEFSLSHVVSNDGPVVLSLDLELPLNPDELYLLEIDLGSTNKPLKIQLEINLSDIHSFTANKRHKEYIFLEPKKLKLTDELHLRLFNADYTLGVGKLLISKLKLEKANVSELSNDSEISFADNLDSYFLKGFWGKESWGRWTAKKESSLFFLASESFCQETYLLLEVKAFFAGVNPARLEVHLNDKKLDSVKVETLKNGKKYYFDCSGFDYRHVLVNTLTFSTDKVLVPLIIGKSNDPRSLGVGLVNLKFVDRGSIELSDGK